MTPTAAADPDGAAEALAGAPEPASGFLTEEVIGMVLLAAAAVLAAVQITSRSVFDTTFIWIEEAVVVLVIWATYLGVSAITWRGLHIRMDLLANSLPARAGAAVNFVAAALTCLYLGVVGWLGCLFLVFLKGTGEENPSLLLPQWWLYVGFPVGIAAAFLRSILSMRRWPQPTGHSVGND